MKQKSMSLKGPAEIDCPGHPLQDTAQAFNGREIRTCWKAFVGVPA